LFFLVGANEAYRPERGHILVAESPYEVIEIFLSATNPNDVYNLGSAPKLAMLDTEAYAKSQT